MKIKQIASDYNLRVTVVTPKNIDKVSKKFDIEKDNLTDNAYVIGNEDIILGIYSDKEIKLAVFFHEIGHTLISESYEKLVNDDEMLIEYEAWIHGLRIAKKYGYKFSGKTFKYILNAINTYFKSAIKAYNTKKNMKKNKSVILDNKKLITNLEFEFSDQEALTDFLVDMKIKSKKKFQPINIIERKKKSTDPSTKLF